MHAYMCVSMFVYLSVLMCASRTWSELFVPDWWGAILVLWVPCSQITYKNCKCLYIFSSNFNAKVWALCYGFQCFHQNFQAQEPNLYRHYVASTVERDGMALLFLSSILCYTCIRMYKNLVMPFFFSIMGCIYTNLITPLLIIFYCFC